MLIGAHVPTTGGLDKAPQQGRAIGATAIQIFTRNQVQWKSRPISGDEAASFRAAMAAAGLRVCLSHASYLVNLASPDPKILAKSRDAFVAELERCEALGIPYAVLHPGAHMGAGAEVGLRSVSRALAWVLDHAESPSVTPLLEVTAGQGSYLASRFEELAAILDGVASAERIGVCLDTCHLFAAGYNIATAEGYGETLESLDRLVGLSLVKAVHVNDAKKGLGSRLDRHEAIGEGALGLEAFRLLLADRRLEGRPMILETPGPPEAWAREITMLRKLVAEDAATVPAS